MEPNGGQDRKDEGHQRRGRERSANTPARIDCFQGEDGRPRRGKKGGREGRRAVDVEQGKEVGGWGMRARESSLHAHVKEKDSGSSTGFIHLHLNANKEGSLPRGLHRSRREERRRIPSCGQTRCLPQRREESCLQEGGGTAALTLQLSLHHQTL